MNITESNKLIAEFMGWSQQKHPEERWVGQWFDTNGVRKTNLLFDTSWDWLMPVVGMIDEICGIDLHEWDEHINSALITKNIEIVYRAVVEFIQWHNKPTGIKG